MATTARLVSSFRITPWALALAITAPAEGDDSVSVKRSLSSPPASAATGTVMVRLASPLPITSVPEGKAPPAKSSAVAGSVPGPLAPATAQATLWLIASPPLRTTVKT